MTIHAIVETIYLSESKGLLMEQEKFSFFLSWKAKSSEVFS